MQCARRLAVSAKNLGAKSEKLESVVNLGVSDKISVPENATVFSAIQPTGVFHLGNYLGAVRSWVDIAQEAPASAKIIYAVADLHAITIPKDPKSLREWRHQALASIIASGVDPERCTLYHQSAVSAHTQLYWALGTMTGMGYLSRMVQWKSKMNVSESSNIDKMDDKLLSKVQLGLFAYPALQAADILLHKATLVPVGDDQSQHLELTRYITSTFNHRFPGNSAGESSGGSYQIFPMPSTLLAPFKKILSLRDATKKMSKSDPDQNGCLYITDEPDIIKKKIRKALTDSSKEPIVYDPIGRPAISNLILLTAGLVRQSPEEFMKIAFNSPPVDHKLFKDTITEVIVESLSGVRTQFLQLSNNPDYLESIAERGRLCAEESGNKTIKEVYEAMGF